MKNYIKDYIIDRLDDLQGRSIYLCDFARYLYESDNINGSITYNRAEALEFIKEHEDEYRNVIKYWAFHSGAEFSNEIALAFFDNPEKAHCFLVFCYVDAILNLWLGKRDDWNEEKEITPEFIQEIKKNLDDMIDAGFNDLDSYGNE